MEWAGVPRCPRETLSLVSERQNSPALSDTQGVSGTQGHRSTLNP